MQPTRPLPPYPTAPGAPQASGLAVAALILGIVGVVGGWCAFGIPCAAAILCGHFALAATRHGRMTGRGMAATGLTLGYVVVIPAFALSLMWYGGSSSPTPAQPPTGVRSTTAAPPAAAAKVTACRIDREAQTAEVTFTVTNKGSSSADYEVRIEVRDGSGVRVGTGSGSVVDVAAGSTAAGTATAVLDVPSGKTCVIAGVR